MEKISIVKIGGNIIDQPDQLHQFGVLFSHLPGKKLLVHGGGKIATEIGEKLGIASRYHNGRRITDRATLDLVTMVYGGLINKKLVDLMQSTGVNAIGLTGADAHLMPAVKRPVTETDYGFVGDMQAGEINVPLLQLLFGNDLVPVLAPLTYDGAGNMLNTNADTVANNTAIALSSFFNVHLYYCFDKKGVLLDRNDPDSILPEVNNATLATLKERKILTDGILPKLDNAMNACENGVKAVYLGAADGLLQHDNPVVGTKIVFA